jgi:ketosteroid isomerase-like protein
MLTVRLRGITNLRFAGSAAALAAIFVLTTALAPAQSPTPGDARIRAMMQKSVDDWNRGDLDAFATSYKNSPGILFIGRTIRHGYADMLASYKAGFNTPAKMGNLSFSQLETQPLDAHFATVTGHFHLERTAEGGGNADGYYLLVVELTPSGWKIVRDDTTDIPHPTQ